MKKFEQELENLKRRVVEMGHTTEEMVALSTSALDDRDQTAIERVLAHEATLDRFQVEIDGEAGRLITIYTPIARNSRCLLMYVRTKSEVTGIDYQKISN